MYKQITKEGLTDVFLENFSFQDYGISEIVEVIWAAMQEVKNPEVEYAEGNGEHGK